MGSPPPASASLRFVTKWRTEAAATQPGGEVGPDCCNNSEAAARHAGILQ
jgi:hypothetical protein